MCTEVLGKFGIECYFVHEINFLVDLPKNTFKSYDTIAYRISLRNTPVKEIKVTWKKQSEQFDDFLFPKHVTCHEEIAKMLDDYRETLVCRRHKKNGCFDFEGGQNYDFFFLSIVKHAQRLTGESSAGMRKG